MKANIKKSKSLKPLLIRFFLVGPTGMIICVIILSFHSINALMTNKIELTIHDSLNDFSANIDATVAALNQVAYQFTEGSIGEDIILLDYATPYEKTQIVSRIREQIELISFTYNDLRVITFYLAESKGYLYPNKNINPLISPIDFPMLMQKNQFSYSAPHVSIDQYAYHETPVISLLKKINHPNLSDMYVYVEMDFNYRNTRQRSDLFAQEDFFVITDSDGEVIFSEKDTLFPLGEIFPDVPPENFPYYSYQHTASPGYQIIYFVPKSEYNREKYTWLSQIFLLVLLYGLFLIISFYCLWKRIIRPIKQAENEIRVIRIGDLDTVPRFTGVLEYDRLVEELIYMKQELSDLIAQTKQQEARQGRLEIEKLMYQINPHFLMNSLNTIYWMTTLNKQTKIGKSISALNKLLQYNLNHKQPMVRLKEEIDAIRQYILLQQLRYDFHYHFTCDDDSLQDFIVPRFILQPMVENSILHGLNGDNGLITIALHRQNGLEIEIKDNGCGMSPQTIDSLMNLQDSVAGPHEMGIGINYVIKILQNRYGKNAFLKIESALGEGTVILLHIPSE